MIRIVNLTKTYENNFSALNHISLNIARNEFVYLVGPSGAGKSTLLKMIFREELPTSGNIFVDNFSLKKIRRSQIPHLRRNMGIIFQDFKLLPRRNVFENVAFALRVMNYPRVKIRKQVHQVLELVSLHQKMNNMPSELSGGEQQRICIARAIVNNPTILLADEPTGSLDPDTSWEIMQLLSKINSRKTTVIVATHDKGIVDDIRKRVIALKNGKIIRDSHLGLYEDK